MTAGGLRGADLKRRPPQIQPGQAGSGHLGQAFRTEIVDPSVTSTLNQLPRPEHFMELTYVLGRLAHQLGRLMPALSLHLVGGTLGAIQSGIYVIHVVWWESQPIKYAQGIGCGLAGTEYEGLLEKKRSLEKAYLQAVKEQERSL